MKITRQQLKRIIKEEKLKLISERGTGNPALYAEEREVRDAVVAFADKYMLTMSMNPGIPADAKRVRNMIDNIINGVMGGILR